MEKHTIIMDNKKGIKKSKMLSLILALMIVTFSAKSQELKVTNDPNYQGSNFIRIYKPRIDFLPIDSLLEKVWFNQIKNDDCLPLIKGNLIFPSVVEKVVIDATNGLKFDFGSKNAISLFKKYNLDSIICLPARDAICLVNIYTNQIIFSYKRGLRPDYEGPFFPEENTLYYGFDNVLYAYNFLNKKNLWQTKIDRYINNFFNKYKNYIILNDKSNLLIIDNKNGCIVQKFKTLNYYSDIVIGKNLYYSGSNEIVKVNLDTFQQDTLVYTSTYFLGSNFFIEGDIISYSISGQLYNYSLSKKTNKQITSEEVCSSPFIKIGQYIIAEASEPPDVIYTKIYDTKNGLPIYKFFFNSRDGDYYNFDQRSYSFPNKLTDNGLLIGYTFRGEIQAFRFRNKK